MSDRFENFTDKEMKDFLKKQIDDRRAKLLTRIKWHLSYAKEYGDDSLYTLVDMLGDAIENGVNFVDQGRYYTSQFQADAHENLPFIKEQADVIKGLTELIVVLEKSSEGE